MTEAIIRPNSSDYHYFRLHSTLVICKHVFVQIKGGISSNDFRDVLRGLPSPTTALLRIYVDEWLETGLDGEAEEPYNRALAKAPQSLRALHRYISEYPPPTVMTLRKTHTEEEIRRLKLTQDQVSFVETAAKDGFFSIFGHGHLLRDQQQPFDPAKHAEDHAAYLLALLIDSDWACRLFKCRRCGGYEVLKRNPRKRYKRGMHCSNCANTASATVSTREGRGKQLANRLEATAAAWNTWKPSSKQVRADWVVERANRRLEVADRITKKWVTRFRLQIEAKVAEENR